MVKKEKIEDKIASLMGNDFVPIMRMFKNGKDISEIYIAKIIKKEVNEVRNLLYKLYEYNLVSFEKKKDKRKGWYIYYWSFDSNRAKEFIGIMKKRELSNLKGNLHFEKSNQFFVCSNNCAKLDFETAIELNFKCPECGSLTQQYDNKDSIMEMERRINSLNKELKIR